MPPVRNRVDIAKSLAEKQQKAKKIGENPGFKRDVTPMPDYYKAWDKFETEMESETITYQAPPEPMTQ